MNSNERWTIRLIRSPRDRQRSHRLMLKRTVCFRSVLSKIIPTFWPPNPPARLPPKTTNDSRKMNIFMYGADEKRRGVSCPSARVFPKLLSWNRLGRKYVSFKECSFAVKKGREATARVVVVSYTGRITTKNDDGGIGVQRISLTFDVDGVFVLYYSNRSG